MTHSSQSEFAAWLFAQSCEFMLGVAHIKDLPADSHPEVTFAGRSNVGKSSLINALTNRNGIARTSNTPGRTQQLNYFNLGNKLHIVDLPGFGYAAAPKDVVHQWQEMILAYLKGRPSLKRVYLLIDARHGIKKVDKEHMDIFDEAALSYQVILTKIDKLKSAQQNSMLEKTQQDILLRPAAHPTVIATSSEKNIGIQDVRSEISRFVKTFKEDDSNDG